MTSFSQRKGLKPVKNVIQVDSIDEALRNGLWDAIKIYYIDVIYERWLRDRNWKDLPLKVWHSYFKKPIDTIPDKASSVIEHIRKYFFSCEWYEIYDFIEFIISVTNRYDFSLNEFINFCNSILKREVSAYRIVGDKVTEMTSEEEIKEIEEALDATNSLKPVYHHLKRSLDLFADRKSPDYRNSIKESISAVESICNLVTKNTKATLGQALKEMEKKVELHPALKKAFDSLYGYTSNAEGIRHALLDEPNLDFEDAKFMLVSCSAFINYLLTKSTKAGIKF